MDFLDKFTLHLRNTLKEAAGLASELRQAELQPEHLLYALSKQKGSIGTEILVKAGLTPDTLKESVIQRNPVSILTASQPKTEPVLSRECKKALEKAMLTATQYQHRYVGTEHLLLSLLNMENKGVQEMFRTHQVSPADLQQHLVVVLKNTSKFPDLSTLLEQPKEDEEMGIPQGPQRAKERGSALDFFCTELTDEHLQEHLDPVIGREHEIERLIHILSRRTKNNPVLTGDPGVGKTAIVEGLAKRIYSGDVPAVLTGKKIMSLDLSLVIAGTVYRGEFESRIKQIIEEVKGNTNIILFIDELHTIIGAGGASGALDAANILKPALAKGHLRCIGATTLEEFHKHIESDAALERRFQQITVDEPSRDETLKILEGVKDRYEKYHQVGITDSAVRAATDMSIRYLQDRFLPDKAIDLIDEAASKVKINKHDNSLLLKMQELEDQLELVREQKQEAVNQENFDRAMTLKHREAEILDTLAAVKDEQARASKKMLGRINEKDVAAVVSRITGVPVGDLVEQEQKRILRIDAELKKHIIGQDEVVQSISSFIKRSRAGLASPDRPLGSFIFLGPSGVGKTEMAKVLAKTVFGSEKALIRFDMSEYAESFQASKLIGAPAGYVGYKEGGKLTESVKRRPYSVLLFDEIEKAHPDIFNLLLQILDEGHLTDAVGKRINYKNTIIILTSNIGLAELNRQAAIGFADTSASTQAEQEFQHIQEKVMEKLRERFRLEFLNRIDKTFVFRPLKKEYCRAIVEIQLARLADQLASRHITLRFDDSVKEMLAEKGFSPEQGARGLRHAIQEHVENPLADHLLKLKEKRPALTIGYADNTLTITPA